MINRLGLIAFRIAMQFTALRAFQNGTIQHALICTDKDFQNALTIVSTLQKNAIDLYYRLPRPKVSKEASELEKELLSKAEQIAICRQMKEQGISYSEIANKVLGDPKKKGTVYKWLNRVG